MKQSWTRPYGPRRDNSPLDCFLNGLSVGTTAGASFTNSIVIETLVIDYELNSETKRKSRSFDLLFLFGSPSWTRTNDIVINSHALYRLSYWGIFN